MTKSSIITQISIKNFQKNESFQVNTNTNNSLLWSKICKVSAALFLLLVNWISSGFGLLSANQDIWRSVLTMNIPLVKHRKGELTGQESSRLQNRPSEIGWNNSSVTTLIHKLRLSQSPACSLAVHLLVSHLIYLATSNIWLKPKTNTNTLNMHWNNKIYHSRGCCERHSMWSSRHSCHGKVGQEVDRKETYPCRFDLPERLEW